MYKFILHLLARTKPQAPTTERWCGGKNGWDNYVERWH